MTSEISYAYCSDVWTPSLPHQACLLYTCQAKYNQQIRRCAMTRQRHGWQLEGAQVSNADTQFMHRPNEVISIAAPAFAIFIALRITWTRPCVRMDWPRPEQKPATEQKTQEQTVVSMLHSSRSCKESVKLDYYSKKNYQQTDLHRSYHSIHTKEGKTLENNTLCDM